MTRQAITIRVKCDTCPNETIVEKYTHPDIRVSLQAHEIVESLRAQGWKTYLGWDYCSQECRDAEKRQ